jgi:hypothetical protein
VDAPLARYRLAQGSLSSNPVGMSEARLRVLDRAAARTDLDPHEQEVVARAQARELREFQWRLLIHLLGEGGHGVRRAALAVVIGAGQRPRSRAVALLALVSPDAARRHRRRRVGQTVEIGSGIRVRRT